MASEMRLVEEWLGKDEGGGRQSQVYLFAPATDGARAIGTAVRKLEIFRIFGLAKRTTDEFAAHF
jgi:hypothetical protein